MLRYKDKEDIERRYREVDGVVEEWQVRSDEASEELIKELNERLMISLIYHDAALEGEVLSHGEIKAAIDTDIISDTSLIPAYEDITAYHKASLLSRTLTKSKRTKVTLDTFREIHGALAQESVQGNGYRKLNPLHRLYYHEIAPPEKISYQMRKFGDWLETAEVSDMHPLNRAAQTHWRLMAIFPWQKESGRAARIAANMILHQAGYPTAIIHSIDRQKYYEALRAADTEQLLSVYLEAVETTAASANRVFDEAARHKGRRRAS